MTRVTEFAVTAVAYQREEDLDVEYLVLAEYPDGGGRRIEIQRSLSPAGPEDVELGMDTYCLVDESGATHYGGVRAWRLQEHQLHIELDAQAAQTLETDGFLLHLVEAGAPARTVKAALGKILGK